MSVNALNPYIHYNGTAEQAIRLYESALGAKVESLMRRGEMPGATVDPTDANLVMRAVVHIGVGQ